jgi:hypothetical protein
MDTDRKSSNVLLVGAYERENFGDLLFLLQTEKYLQGIRSHATAPFRGQMLGLLGKNVDDYGGAVKQILPDSVWVVGGEVGGTSLPAAFRMSADDNEYAKYLALNRRSQRAELERITRLQVSASPYMPRMSAFTETYGSTLVINSVGLSGMRNLIGDRRDEAWGAVREASYVSVRDTASSQMLRQKSIAHVLAPDLVHTLAMDSSFQSRREPDLALIQVKAPVLEKYGVENFSRLLVASKALAPFRLRFFTAGSARGHDDRKLYEQVADEVRLLDPSRTIDVSQTEQPLDKAREIANCGLWVGTSLHGLIISSAFDIPRVGLVLEKLVRYAQSWQESMPVGVQLEELDAAVTTALAEEERSRRSQRSSELARLAHESISAAVDVLRSPVKSEERVQEREYLAEKLAKRKSMPWRKAHVALQPLT